MAGIVRPGAHRTGRNVEEVPRLLSPIGDPWPKASGALDQNEAQGPLRLPQQLTGQQCSAEAGPHDGDDWIWFRHRQDEYAGLWG